MSRIVNPASNLPPGRRGAGIQFAGLVIDGNKAIERYFQPSFDRAVLVLAGFPHARE